MKKPRSHYQLNEPLKHPDHKRPVTRRDFIAQGFLAGMGAVMGQSLLTSLLFGPQNAHGALSADLQALRTSCGLTLQGAGKIPFICFDLAGGANIAGSNVLVGKQGGPLDFLTTAGYRKLGLPGDMLPSSSTTNFINNEFGLPFHADSAFLRGMLERVAVSHRALVNGVVIPALSDNDTGNNPHNPMYGIYRAGAAGALLTLIGSRSSDSGGNSMAPAGWIDLSVRPTKIDRPRDVTGLVDTGKLVGLLNQADAVAVMETAQRLSDVKLTQVDTKLSTDRAIKDQVRCGYVKAADLIDRYGDPSVLNPALDSDIVGTNGIFTTTEFNRDGEFAKTASVMKLVVNGYAGAGTITMNGFDYHTGERATGELRDLRAGRCIGACLEYAARKNVPIMIYVFSDGSLASNGTIDSTPDGRGKGVWTGDSSATAASFFLVYNPAGRPVARRQQIGWFRADASVDTSSSPAANNVNLLAETLVLNYMALHGEQGSFATRFPNHGLGNSTLQESLIALEPIVNGRIPTSG